MSRFAKVGIKIEYANCIDARIAMRQECSCFEEYLLKRDLELNMSMIEKVLDPIALVEKHPMFCYIVDGILDNMWFSLFIWIAIMSLSHFLLVILKLAFPDASQSCLMFGLMFLIVGHGCIMLAFLTRILNAIFVMHLAKTFKTT